MHLASDGAFPSDYPNFKSKDLYVLDPWETDMDGNENISNPEKEFGRDKMDLFYVDIANQNGMKLNMLNHPDTPESWLYIGDNDEKGSRYILGQPGAYNLVIVGLNPSTATPLKLDPTIARIKKIIENEIYDGWIMINLYAKRETKPENLPKKINKNIAECNHLIVKMLCESYNIGAVYAAWGTNIEKHDYLLVECQALMDLIPAESWFTRGVTKYGHPKHPLYVPYEQEFDWFPVQDYVRNMR